MTDLTPVAHFLTWTTYGTWLTWTTYGTWLHGDARGSHFGSWFIPMDDELEEASREQMTDEPVFLSDEQRQVVDAGIVEMCARRGWTLHARNVRTNHVHVVLTAGPNCKVVLAQLKARLSRLLSEHAGLCATIYSGKNGQCRWWTEKGRRDWIMSLEGLGSVVIYVRDLQ